MPCGPRHGPEARNRQINEVFKDFRKCKNIFVAQSPTDVQAVPLNDGA
jgi:hypothetical protein